MIPSQAAFGSKSVRRGRQTAGSVQSGQASSLWGGAHAIRAPASVADGTKFIAAACQYTKSEDLWELVLSTGTGVEVALPMGCVMTLPAVIVLFLISYF